MNKIHYKIFFFASAALMLLGTSLPYESEWTLKRTVDGMTVYTRDREGSEIKQVKLVMTVNANIEDINDVLIDASRQPEWVFKCTEAKDLGGQIETGWYYYSRIALPWPMDDRDLIAKVVGESNHGHYTSKSIAAPDRAPLVEDCVRITDFDVFTEYHALTDSTTQMTYELHSEPGGSVPNWLVNLFIDKGPVETMTKLKELVEEE
jgi:hypothetical protein